MIKTINETEFIDAFRKRDMYKNNFSYDGLKELFRHFNDYDGGDFGHEIELDVIKHCSEFTEYENLAEIKKDYSDIETVEQLQNQTTVIPVYNAKSYLPETGTNDMTYIIKDF